MLPWILTVGAVEKGLDVDRIYPWLEVPGDVVGVNPYCVVSGGGKDVVVVDIEYEEFPNLDEFSLDEEDEEREVVVKMECCQ